MEGGRVNEKLQRLREAVTGRGREVEVGPDGSVREIEHPPGIEDVSSVPTKPTKLADRTFGRE